MTFKKTSSQGYKYIKGDITIHISYVWGYRKKEFEVNVFKGYNRILTSFDDSLSTLKSSKEWLVENYK